MTKEIQDKIDAAALSECIYEPKYGGKDHSGYETMMKYEINGERVEAFSNGATFGYNLAQEEVVKWTNAHESQVKIGLKMDALLVQRDKEIERLKGLIKDAYNLGYDASSFAHSSNLQELYERPETFEEFKTENNL